MNMKSPIDKLVAASLSGGFSMAFIILSIVLGMIALNYTSREEEPQIVVPMVDVLVESPGLSAKQVARQVTIPLEKLMAQIPGVENVYSTSSTGKTSVTLRFYVGENREEAILNTYNKLYSNQDTIPPVVANWLVRPVEVDDVPIVMLALWSDDAARMSDFELRRVADEISTSIQAISDTSEVHVVGGRPRTIRILPKPESLAAHQSTSGDIVSALHVSNVLTSAGYWSLSNESLVLESGDFIRSVQELRQTVINVVDGSPVFLQDVADIIDGPAEPSNYTWIDFSQSYSPIAGQLENFPMVAISVAKQRGSNAVSVAKDVHDLVASLKDQLLPKTVHIEVLRDYGSTADEKVANLTASLAFAVFTVVVFIGVFLGWRPALVVGIAVPISYGITLALDMAFGYTINRVTLFALILSLGLLVDDPITGVDNIERFLKTNKGTRREKIVAAISEIKIPLLMSTLTIILAFIPLAFITGMMGPYMAPMAFNVPISVATSTFIAFLVTPWLSSKILVNRISDEGDAISATKKAALQSPTEVRNGELEKANDDDKVENENENESGLLNFYRKLLGPLLTSKRKAKYLLWGVLVLFVVAALLPVLRLVPLKLLPFDNKNELQVIIDMPESSTLEQTAGLVQQVSGITRQLNEVEAVASFVGVPSPIDFNGMVRHYYHRSAPFMADMRVKLIDKELRQHQSHAVVLRLRELLAPLNVSGVEIKVVEVPPGPPVLSTLVAEVRGTTLTSYDEIRAAAKLVQERLKREAFVVGVDTTVEDEQRRLRFVTDKQKAALSGISTLDINNTLLMANQGYRAGFLQTEREAKPLPIELRLSLAERSSIQDLQRLQVRGRPGIVKTSSDSGLKTAAQPSVPLGELGEFDFQLSDKSIHRKDLQPVAYVVAELSGRTPAEVIADVNADLGSPAGEADDWQSRHFLQPGSGDGWSIPDGINIVWTGEGEWKITVDVFRDMGFAFIFALVGIFFVLKIQTSSTSLSLIIMSAIPLTIIGIMPGFFLLNQFGDRQIGGAPDPVLFTATAMIGMIALAGIVVRNSLILVEFITQARGRGLPLHEALIQAGAVRMRPILLTAGTTLLGSVVIILDPVFSGLALAIMFGIISSTVFTLLVVPVVYSLVFKDEQEVVA
jgi:multidrug efflux pump subunit AcrB